MSEHWPQNALIVLGASADQVPLYQEARRRGVPTIAVDMRQDSVAFPLADAVLKVSTRDADAIVDALGDLRPAGVVCGASDVALPTWRALSLRYGSPYVYPENALVARDKAAFHNIADSCGVAGYGWVASDDPKEIVAKAAGLRFPVIVKPVDDAGSRGVLRVAHPDDLPAAVAHSRSVSRSQRMMVEEFCEGRPLVIEMFMKDGRAKFVYILDEEPADTSFAIKRLHSPARLSPATRERLEVTAERLCLALGVTDGPADFDIVLGADGRERVIEANPRLGGDGLSRFLTIAQGVDNVGALISLTLGEPPDAYLEPTHTVHTALEVIGSPLDRDGELVRWEGVTEARAVPGIVDITLLAEPGDLVRPHTQSSHKVGLLIATGSSPESASSALASACSLIRPIVRPLVKEK